jgi:hypothetical protein
MFRTTTQSAETRVLRGMTAEYRQSLSFLPGPLKGLTVNASYVRSYANATLAQVIPHSIPGGISFRYRRLNLYGNMSWRPDYPINSISLYAVGSKFYRHRADLDIGGGYKLGKRYNLFFSARNITAEPYIQMTQYSNGAFQTLLYQNHINWLFGLKGEF